jgi:hypothetical protein
LPDGALGRREEQHLNRRLLLAVLAAAVLVAGLSTALFPPSSSAGGNAQVGALIIWLAGVAVCLTLGLVLASVSVRRRLVARTQFVDSTATPVTFRPQDAELDRQLRRIGFKGLGEVDFLQRRAKPHHLWAYVNSNRTVRATISQNWNRVSFITCWPDGFSLETASRKLPGIHLPHHLQQGVSGVGGAHDLHRQTLGSLAGKHGRPFKIQSIDDLIAAEQRDLAVVLPEMAARDRLPRLVILGIIAVFAVTLVVTRPF